MTTQPDNGQHFPRIFSDTLRVVGNYYFNLYLVQGANASALVEAGVSATVDSVIAQLEAVGVEPDYLVLSHPHTDHFTGLAGLAARYPSATVVAGIGAREFVIHPKAAGTMMAEDRFISEQLARRGLKPGRPPVDTIAFPDDYLSVDGSHSIDLGGIHLDLLQVGGHSPGNLVAYVPEKKYLLVSDSLGFHYPGRGFCPLFFTGYPDYMATLEHLAGLDFDILGPAHQGALEGAAARQAMNRARRAGLDFAAGLSADLRDAETVAGDLFRRYYKDEFGLYSPENIMNCMRLLVRRLREATGPAE